MIIYIIDHNVEIFDIYPSGKAVDILSILYCLDRGYMSPDLFVLNSGCYSLPNCQSLTQLRPLKRTKKSLHRKYIAGEVDKVLTIGLHVLYPSDVVSLSASKTLIIDCNNLLLKSDFVSRSLWMKNICFQILCHFTFFPYSSLSKLFICLYFISSWSNLFSHGLFGDLMGNSWLSGPLCLGVIGDCNSDCFRCYYRIGIFFSFTGLLV
jgi:hypothetical protein